MDIGQITGLVTDNWGTITTVGLAVGGGYAIKVKMAINNVLAVVDEVKETHKAFADAFADKVITPQEAENLGRELQEDLVKIQNAANSIASVLPARWRKKIPVEFT